MKGFSYIIRNYRPEDFNSYVQFHVEIEKLEPSGRCTSPEVLSENLRRPTSSPEQDMFIAEKNGKIVGIMNITPEQPIKRAILDCLVHPAHRRQGLATKLLDHALRRAKELKAKVAHVNVMQNNTAAYYVLPRLGFNVVRQFLELRLLLPEFPVAASRDYSCRPMQYGEEDKLTKIQNRSFAGTWGYNPNTIETITRRLKWGHGSPQDVIMAFDQDKPVGYCWTTINLEAEAASGKKKARIYMLGVDPDVRDRQIGRALLLAGLHRLKAQDISIIELTVDSENEAALALYRSAGFKVRATSLWYEKIID